MSITIRPAMEQDQATIHTLARRERVKPTGLNWPNFLVATEGDAIIGMVQLRRHADGSKELGSLVVQESSRGQSIARRMIETALAKEQGSVYMITAAVYAPHYSRFGFRTVQPSAAPSAIRRNFHIGAIGGGMISLLMGRRPRQLAILERNLGDAQKAA